MAIFGWLICLIAALGVSIYGFMLTVLSTGFVSKETPFIALIWLIMSSALWYAVYAGAPFTVTMN